MLDTTTLPITFENTRLRALSDWDAEAYASGTRDEAVRRFGHLPEPDYTPDSVRRMIRDEVAVGLSTGTLAVLALADAEADRFVGSMVLFDVSSEAAEVGFWIHPDARGAGHARRGLELASRFARNSGLRTLTARTLLENKASQRCLTNAGFHEVERAVGTTPAGQREELFHYRRALKPNALKSDRSKTPHRPPNTTTSSNKKPTSPPATAPCATPASSPSPPPRSKTSTPT